VPVSRDGYFTAAALAFHLTFHFYACLQRVRACSRFSLRCGSLRLLANIPLDRRRVCRCYPAAFAADVLLLRLRTTGADAAAFGLFVACLPHTRLPLCKQHTAWDGTCWAGGRVQPVLFKVVGCCRDTCVTRRLPCRCAALLPSLWFYGIQRHHPRTTRATCSGGRSSRWCGRVGRTAVVLFTGRRLRLRHFTWLRCLFPAFTFGAYWRIGRRSSPPPLPVVAATACCRLLDGFRRDSMPLTAIRCRAAAGAATLSAPASPSCSLFAAIALRT